MQRHCFHRLRLVQLFCCALWFGKCYLTKQLANSRHHCFVSQPQFKFSGFQAGLKSDASLSANSTAVLKGYTSVSSCSSLPTASMILIFLVRCIAVRCCQLLDGIFAQEVTVAVLSGVVTLKHSGVYFFAASVHFITTLNDTCDGGSGTIKVAICADNDCKNKA